MEKREFYVDIGGEQQFTSIGDALEAAGQYTEGEAVIHVAPGTYRERLEIKQDHIALIGAGADRTRITYSDGALDLMPEGDKRGTFRTQSVFIDADHFTLVTFLSAMRRGRAIRSDRRLQCMRTGII